MSTEEFVELFTADKPVVFAFHNRWPTLTNTWKTSPKSATGSGRTEIDDFILPRAAPAPSLPPTS